MLHAGRMLFQMSPVPPQTFLEKKGCSRPRQLAPTNRYLYKVHWWIYSLSLTTEISNNLSQMPSAILSPLLSLHRPPPHFLQLMSTLPPLSVCWSISGWWCEGWSLPFVSWFNNSMLFQTVYRKTWMCLLPPRAVSFKGEKERERALRPPLSVLPLSPPLHLLAWTLHNSSLLSGCVKHHRLFLQDR